MSRLEGSAKDEWRRGWRLPFVAALGYGLGNVFGHSFGVYVAPLEAEFGWSRGEISSAFTVISLVLAAFLPFIGRLIDRYGPRRIAIPGAIFYCCALAALSLTGPSLWSWWALWALVGLAGVTVQAPVWTAAVSSRFHRTRGTALAITFLGGAITTTFLPILCTWLIGEYGWRGAYVGMAGICAILVIPLVAMAFYDARDMGGKDQREKPAAVAAQAPENVRATLLSSRFIRLSLAAFLLMIGITALLIHFIPILGSAGLTPVQAAGAASLIGIGSILGRLLCGYLLDRISGALVGGLAFGFPAVVAGLLMMFDGSLGNAMVIAFAFGVCVGGEVDVLAYITGRHFGLKSYGTLFAILVAIQNLAYAIGPPLAGTLYDRTGGYDLFLTISMPLFLVAALLVATLGRYPEETERQAEEA